MFIRTYTNRRWGAACLLMAVLFVAISLLSPVSGFAEEFRKVKTRVAAVYPDVARRSGIAGTVKVEAVVSPSGDVKEARLIGGHPLLGAAAVEAIKKWKYEPGPGQSTLVVEFNFHS